MTTILRHILSWLLRLFRPVQAPTTNRWVEQPHVIETSDVAAELALEDAPVPPAEIVSGVVVSQTVSDVTVKSSSKVSAEDIKVVLDELR